MNEKNFIKRVVLIVYLNFCIFLLRYEKILDIVPHLHICYILSYAQATSVCRITLALYENWLLWNIDVTCDICAVTVY